MRATRWLAALLILFTGSAALAHALPGTAILLDFGRTDVGMELQLPLDQFELGFKHPVMDAPLQAVKRYPKELPAYLLQHVQPIAPDGRPWRVQVESLDVVPATDISPVDLHARLKLTPPVGASARKFRLNYSVINHEVMSHTALVFARSDWQNSVFGSDPEMLGTIRFIVTGIDVDRSEGSFWRGFNGIFHLGMQHIAEGTDHLLFLLVLLLPAPLLRNARRWNGFGGVRHALVRIATLVTAFTVGHSVTLIIGTFGNVTVPAAPVEILIAHSILVSALHAWRPLLHGREAWIAAGFGLVHGLAFAQTIAGSGLDGWQKAAAVLGFNLGIEVFQLFIVALVVPWLILLARAGHYTALRVGGAAFAGIASLGWMIERSTGKPNPISQLLEHLLEAGPYLIGLLAVAALVADFRRRSVGEAAV